jgi:hypothetical protein
MHTSWISTTATCPTHYHFMDFSILTTPGDLSKVQISSSSKIQNGHLASTVLRELFTRATDPEVRVRVPALPDFLRSSGSETGPTQPREYN